MTIAKRKGARSIKEIPVEILEQLNRGEIESANLVEFIGIDSRLLLENVLLQCGRQNYLKAILNKIDGLTKFTFVTISTAICDGLYEQIIKHNDMHFVTEISRHSSDLVRSWAAILTGKDSSLNIEQTLQNIKAFAADKHFNVRECAWSAVRHSIIDNLAGSIEILSAWAKDEDENIRRFASEVTRPRGVWCEQIAVLKKQPELALPILEALKSDPSRYVQNSVANWLNDASKSKAEFTVELCARWEKESKTKETKYIIKRALRTLDKVSKKA